MRFKLSELPLRLLTLNVLESYFKKVCVRLRFSMAMISDFCYNYKCLCKPIIAFLFVSTVIEENFSKYIIHGNFEAAGMR